MAQDVNKSQAIRDYCAAHPDETPADVAEALSKKHRGLKFTNSQVSTVLYNAKQSKAKGTKPATKAKPQASSGDSLDQALAFVQVVGGLDQAQALLDRLREIREAL